MVDIITDKYILGQSQTKAINSPGEEVRLDLNLSIDGTGSIGGTVEGVVQDGLGSPIKGALVKLMTITYDPVMHTMTDATGTYTLNNVPVNSSFKIFAIAPGKFLKEGNIIAATLAQKLTMDFTLEDDPSAQLAVVAGDVLDVSNNDPIGGATVTLYSIKGTTETLLAGVNTNQHGQFTFRGLSLGNYSLTITAAGYKDNVISFNTTSQGQIIPLKVPLTSDANNSLGTVSGVINDDTGNPIDGADVILYRVETDNSLTPVAFTKTNSDGVYLFDNVPQATYKIKSNESTIVTVVNPNSPNYYSFAIANATALIPDITPATEAYLINGANLVLDDSFIASVGGVTGGSFDIGITAPFDGYFNVSITYLSGNGDTSIIFQSDPDNSGPQQTINFPKTSSWNASDAKLVTVKMALYSGINAFLVFNDQNVASPWIGDISISYVPYSFSIEANKGQVSKGAIIDALGFVTMIGGPINGGGEVNIPIDIPFTEPYKLKIKYLAGDEDRPLKLDIEGTNVGNFNLPKTNSWTILDAKTYEVEVTAEQGTDNFRFYNDTGSYAANISTLNFSEYTVNVAFLPNQVNLLDGANIQKDASGVSYIAGVVQGQGEIQFVVNVYEDQLYDFQIFYQCNDDRICNVKVGDQLVEYVEFNFSATTSGLGVLECKLFLTEGSNTITIYND